ncbi:Arc family DNA-binding protein [Mesorhizobium sp. M0622]|uniref:Arc family DNA-binding protein n=1 Tax=Mesorhizobium sp. M0622 TaxID=2956975 RepID=UPI003336763C
MAVNENVCHWCVMAREDLHFRLRIPEDLKQRIEAAAALNHRSMTAEIVHRLEESLAAEEPGPIMRSGHWELPSDVTVNDISRVIEEANRQTVSIALKRLGIVQRPFSKIEDDQS